VLMQMLPNSSLCSITAIKKMGIGAPTKNYILLLALLINNTGSCNSPKSEICGASTLRFKQHKKTCIIHRPEVEDEVF
jgi:hypothetical protein